MSKPRQCWWASDQMPSLGVHCSTAAKGGFWGAAIYPDHAGHFVGYGYTGHARRLAVKQREEARIGRIGFVLGSADQQGGANHQELSQIRVARFGDAPEPVLAAARVLRWRPSEANGDRPHHTMGRVADLSFFHPGRAGVPQRSTGARELSNDKTRWMAMHSLTLAEGVAAVTWECQLQE